MIDSLHSCASRSCGIKVSMLRGPDWIFLAHTHCRLSSESVQVFRKVQQFSSLFRKCRFGYLSWSASLRPSRFAAFLHRLLTDLAPMSYRSLYEVVPLVSSGLLRSTSASMPCRSFSAVARAFANTPSPCYVRHDPWSFGFTPLEDVMLSHPILRHTARSMRMMVSAVLRRIQFTVHALTYTHCSA